MSNVQQQYFHRLPIGAKFQTYVGGEVFTKTRKGGTEFDNGTPYNINSQMLVVVVETSEADWRDLDPHTFNFTIAQRDALFTEIIDRAARQYGEDRIDRERLRNGLLCAHRAKPIRLIDLLNTCNLDFPTEILYGVYRHYDPATDSLKGGWTAQHSEPHRKAWWE